MRMQGATDTLGQQDGTEEGATDQSRAQDQSKPLRQDDGSQDAQ